MKRAFFPADILLPEQGTDMSRWSVIACDQFTSEPEYWEETEKIVGLAPSTFKMILPEVYLGSTMEAEKLEQIRRSMKNYLDKGLFHTYKNAMIYVERTDSSGKVRAGIVGAVDLETYNYRKGAQSMVRATEATVVERIPPRIRVRKNAPMELPHIMILIDDKYHRVVEPCEEAKEESQLLYDFDLMQGGGHLKGYLLGQEEQDRVLEALDRLAARQPMTFAVGDGNHSLATAKEYYEQLKAAHPDEDYSTHPARYALVELVNLHSPALEFEAIHRIVTKVDVKHLLSEMERELGLRLEEENVPETDGNQKGVLPAGARKKRPEGQQELYLVEKGVCTKAIITRPTSKLTVGSLQNFLDAYQQKYPIGMDYIHGADTVKELSMEEESIGFLLPDMKKEELFPSVMADGALPRKTFSMGHAEDKRYYMECRMIR